MGPRKSFRRTVGHTKSGREMSRCTPVKRATEPMRGGVPQRMRQRSESRTFQPRHALPDNDEGGFGNAGPVVRHSHGDSDGGTWWRRLAQARRGTDGSSLSGALRARSFVQVRRSRGTPLARRRGDPVPPTPHSTPCLPVKGLRFAPVACGDAYGTLDREPRRACVSPEPWPRKPRPIRGPRRNGKALRWSFCTRSSVGGVTRCLSSKRTSCTWSWLSRAVVRCAERGGTTASRWDRTMTDVGDADAATTTQRANGAMAPASPPTSPPQAGAPGHWPGVAGGGPGTTSAPRTSAHAIGSGHVE